MADGTGGGTKLKAPKLKTSPLFRLCFQMEISPTIEVPGGLRTDLTYTQSGPPVVAYSDSSLKGPLVELLGKGELRSGNDWLFVSDLGVLTFDGTLTLAFGAPDAPCLVTARLRGKARVDLQSRASGSGNEARAWEACLEEDLSFVSSISFEPPTKPLDNASSKDTELLLELGEHQFVGSGQLRAGGFTEIDVFRIDGTKPADNGEALQNVSRAKRPA